jgi:hypothetical protein
MMNWILVLILLCAPPDAQPEGFNDLAAAIDGASNGDPELAAVLVAIACRESHFRADAVGHDAFGESFGFWQLHETMLPHLGLTFAEAFSPFLASEKAAWMVAQSRIVCRERPKEEQLGWYASGGAGCDVPEGLAASRNRMALTAWLLRKQPPFWSSGRVETSVLPKRGH